METAWSTPVLMIDAVHVRIRDGQVANRAVYVAIAVDTDGCRQILGIWAGDGGGAVCAAVTAALPARTTVPDDRRSAL